MTAKMEYLPSMPKTGFKPPAQTNKQIKMVKLLLAGKKGFGDAGRELHVED